MSAALDASLDSLLGFAVESAQLAGRLTLGWFRGGLEIEHKADASPVTIADRSAEKLLRERIARAFPRHGILGEEFGEAAGSLPARWILDPIDGTFSFIHGVPLYSVLVALEWQGEPLIGVIHMPALGETVYAARGLGCRVDGAPARVRATAALNMATVLSSGVHGFARTKRQGSFDRLMGACGHQRGWGDGYAYALVATGRADVALDPLVAIWDAAAVLPVILEAGGRAGTWSGETRHTGSDLVATNGLLHDEVIALLNG